MNTRPHAEQKLAEFGLKPVNPPVQSSMYALAAKDPFGFFLRYKLGLVPANAYSEALSRGGWFAENFRFQHDPERLGKLGTLLTNRLSEISVIVRDFGLGEHARQRMVDKERRDFACALGWYEAVIDLPVPGKGNTTVRSYTSQSKWRLLGTEVLFSYTPPEYEYPFVGRFDSLYFDEKTHKVWVRDDKTTSFSADKRTLTFPVEFQAEHYFFCGRELMPMFIEKFGLPEDSTFGGIMHFAFQKPTIDFGSKDRAYWWASEGKRKDKAGAVKDGRLVIRTISTGELESDTAVDNEDSAVQELHAITGKKPTKVYEKEPDLNRYVERCARWYRAEGEYADKKEEREREPVVAFSYLGPEWFASREERYHQRARMLVELCLTKNDPALYRQGPSVVDEYGRVFPTAELYVNPLQAWPEIITKNRLRVVHRYEQLHHENPDDVVIPMEAP